MSSEIFLFSATSAAEELVASVAADATAVGVAGVAHGDRQGADLGADGGLRRVRDVGGGDGTGGDEGYDEEAGKELHVGGPFWVHLWLQILNLRWSNQLK